MLSPVPEPVRMLFFLLPFQMLLSSGTSTFVFQISAWLVHLRGNNTEQLVPLSPNQGQFPSV